jgi:hypothetical protein
MGQKSTKTAPHPDVSGTDEAVEEQNHTDREWLQESA